VFVDERLACRDVRVQIDVHLDARSLTPIVHQFFDITLVGDMVGGRREAGNHPRYLLRGLEASTVENVDPATLSRARISILSERTERVLDALRCRRCRSAAAAEFIAANSGMRARCENVAGSMDTAARACGGAAAGAGAGVSAPRGGASSMSATSPRRVS
jgi:hypothetical protein